MDTSQSLFLDMVGTQKMDCGSTSVETHCPCTLTRKNNKLYIRYIEDDVSRLITIAGTHLQLRTLGDMASRLEFDPEMPTSGEYYTPCGTLSMQIYTSVLTISDKLDTDNCLNLHMEYRLEVNGEPVSMNKLDLSVS